MRLSISIWAPSLPWARSSCNAANSPLREGQFLQNTVTGVSAGGIVDGGTATDVRRVPPPTRNGNGFQNVFRL
eukprot:172772-Rhodomonas_salina.10